MLPRHHTEQIGDHVEAHIVGGTENARHAPEIAGAARSVGRQRTVEGQRRYPIDPILPEQPDRQIAERVESRASPLLPQQEEERSEEHTSELQSLMRISYAVFCLKKKNIHNNNLKTLQQTK